jgi:predicted nuclease with TOPRIM domain
MIPLEVGANTTDPLALIIAIGGACVSGLASLVLLLLFSRLKRIEVDIKEVGGHLIGDTGMTVKLTDLKGRVRTLEAEVQALKAGTLSRERFELATKDQNDKLEELKLQTKELDHKVDKVDRALLGGRYDSPPPAPPRGNPFRK